MDLIKYSQQYEAALQQYILTEDQLLYTATPIEAVKHLDDDRNAILAFEDDLFVSFFVLQEGAGVAEFLGGPDSVLLRSFSTDFRYQGRGYARKILEKLPAFVKEHYPTKNEITLAVDSGNDRAHQLYEKSGYMDHGKRMPGRNGELIILGYHLV